MTYDHSNAEKAPFFPEFLILGPFQHSNGHNSKNIQDNPIKLYNFEISVKFPIDWSICLRLKKKLKFGLHLAGIQKVPAKIRSR